MYFIITDSTNQHWVPELRRLEIPKEISVLEISERIRKVCRNHNIRVVFTSGPTFRFLLTKMKDPLPAEKQKNKSSESRDWFNSHFEDGYSI